MEALGTKKPAYKLAMTREYYDRVEKDLKKRIFALLIEIDQIILPMIESKDKHMKDEIVRMDAIKARKARKHMIADNWEEKSLESLSDESEEEGKEENRPSDIPSSKYE